MEKKDNELIVGVSGCICPTCVEALTGAAVPNEKLTKALKPHEIKQELDKYVIGQETAKKTLAVEVYNHYKRIHNRSSIDFPKSNVLLIGPTGVGKTYLMEILSKILDVPLATGDATTLTEVGYVGKSVDSLLTDLIASADGDIKKAEQGIIYIDEIDKLAASNDKANAKSVGSSGVQKSLLKMMEGTKFTFEDGTSINTKNILFVCGGAFENLDKIIESRKKVGSSMGFGSSQQITKSENGFKDNLLQDVTPVDLVKFGMVREFLGRVPNIVVLNPLTVDDLKNILTKPKNALLKQYQALFKMDNVRLKFASDAVDYIANEAIKKGTGARGLKSIISRRLNDLMFELPQLEDVKEYTVTKKYLEQN
jgi:ATP-dependent Clp protease ATP-binding subunit ClpX